MSLYTVGTLFRKGRRELELLSKGVKPLPVEFPTKERRKEKIYPNEKCSCGSKLKYKKCHGRINNP